MGDEMMLAFHAAARFRLAGLVAIPSSRRQGVRCLLDPRARLTNLNTSDRAVCPVATTAEKQTD